MRSVYLKLSTQRAHVPMAVEAYYHEGQRNSPYPRPNLKLIKFKS